MTRNIRVRTHSYKEDHCWIITKLNFSIHSRFSSPPHRRLQWTFSHSIEWLTFQSQETLYIRYDLQIRVLRILVKTICVLARRIDARLMMPPQCVTRAFESRVRGMCSREVAYLVYGISISKRTHAAGAACSQLTTATARKYLGFTLQVEGAPYSSEPY